jgi:hypothetical protein
VVKAHRLVATAAAGFLAAATAGPASAAVFAELLRTSAHRGEAVPARVDSWTATHHPPLYLVPARSSTTFATMKGAPKRAPYVRLRDIDWGTSNGSIAKIRFRVPNMKRGSYRLVVYCEPCTTGPLGSLLGSLDALRVR